MPASKASARIIGRYALHDEIASGGMASIHVGRLLGAVGFARTVAIKRLHAQYAKDPEFVSMFLDEARLAARIRHPNVVQTLDVVATKGELFLVMDYIQGESLSRLTRAARAKDIAIPPRVSSAIMVGVLHGLHAAHEAKNERGEPLSIVHRDVSPHNILVGLDGVPRVLDFGVAKAAGRVSTTRDGTIKGKLAYMAPEQLRGSVTRQTDVFAASIVLWETLTGTRLFDGQNEGEVLAKVAGSVIEPPSAFDRSIPAGIDRVTLRGLARDPKDRYATAREMARDLEKESPVASASEISEWVERVAGPEVARRNDLIAEIESETDPSRKLETLAHALKSDAPPPNPDDEATSVSFPHAAVPVVAAPSTIAAPAIAAPAIAAPAIAAPAIAAPAIAAPAIAAPAMAPVMAAPVAAAPALRAPPMTVQEDSASVSIASPSVPPPNGDELRPASSSKRKALVIVPALLVLLLLVFVVRVATRDKKEPATETATEEPTRPRTPPTDLAPTPSASASEASSETAKTEPKIEPKTEPKIEPKTEPKTEPKPTVAKAEAKPTETSPLDSKSAAPLATASKPPKAKPSGSGKPSCDPKYYLDAKGVKIWKPECF